MSPREGESRPGTVRRRRPRGTELRRRSTPRRAGERAPEAPDDRGEEQQTGKADSLLAPQSLARGPERSRRSNRDLRHPPVQARTSAARGARAAAETTAPGRGPRCPGGQAPMSPEKRGRPPEGTAHSAKSRRSRREKGRRRRIRPAKSRQGVERRRRIQGRNSLRGCRARRRKPRRRRRAASRGEQAGVLRRTRARPGSGGERLDVQRIQRASAKVHDSSPDNLSFNTALARKSLFLTVPSGICLASAISS